MATNSDHTQIMMVSHYMMEASCLELYAGCTAAAAEAFSEAGKVQPNEAAVHSAHHIQPAKTRPTVLHNRKGSTVNAATMLGGHIRLRAAAEEGCAFPAEASA